MRAGDSLWAIARHALGPNASPAAVAAMVQRIWTTNAGSIARGTPDIIAVGTRLHLPR